MNKEIFLKELREYLRILEDREQEDILEEYAQHIDMKMQKGLSEEEAIQDFGPIDELAAQILEAYHVKTQFQEKKKFVNFSNPAEKVKEAFSWLGRKCRTFGEWLGRKCHTFGGWLMKPFRREKVKTDKSTKDNQVKERKTKEMGKQIGSVLKAIGNGIVSVCRACCAFCIWCLKWFWNLGWLIFSVFCAFMAMLVLMGLGAIVVLLFQGYPLVGIFFICLGGLLCFGALSGGAYSLLIRKKDDKSGNDKEKTEEKIEEAEKSGGEVQYE